MTLASIIEQLNSADKWTSTLIKDLDEADLKIIEMLGTSINWQIGHIIISKYFHVIQSTLNKEHKLIQSLKDRLPIEDLLKNYFAGSDPLQNWQERPDKFQLLQYDLELDRAVSKTMGIMTEDILNEISETPNPIAKIKRQALIFSFKHQMWHNGQIAMMKRVVRSN